MRACILVCRIFELLVFLHSRNFSSVRQMVHSECQMNMNISTVTNDPSTISIFNLYFFLIRIIIISWSLNRLLNQGIMEKILIFFEI